MTQGNEAEYRLAATGNLDTWVPACGGTETEQTGSDGRKYLYCWNPYRRSHKYVRDDDMIIWDNYELPRSLR